MSDKQPTEQSSFSNNPATYAGAFAGILAALIRMFVPAEYIENALTISAAISPILGVWLFGFLNKKRQSAAQIAVKKKVEDRMELLDLQINNKQYSKEQKEKFLEEKQKLVLEYIQLDKTVD